MTEFQNFSRYCGLLIRTVMYCPKLLISIIFKLTLSAIYEDTAEDLPQKKSCIIIIISLFVINEFVTVSTIGIINIAAVNPRISMQ
jgi:hypothetical protein